MAIGSPVARDFFEPQNTIVIWSGRENPSRRLSWPVTTSTTASSAPATASSTTRFTGVTWCQMPATTPALNAV